MEKEYLDILTEEGIPTGESCLKEKAHEDGLYHATVHVWFYTTSGEVLLQKRGANKETFPNYWDVSVAGHVMAGETIKNAALREVNEEIGLTINPKDLHKIGVRKSINIHPNGIKDCEFQNVFLCQLNVRLSKLNKQHDEVDELRLHSLETFKSLANNNNNNKNNNKLVPADYSYYTSVIDNIIKML